MTKEVKKEKKKEVIVTNKKFSEGKFFKACCEEANVDITTRQASKFRMEKGSAFKVRKRVAKVQADADKEAEKNAEKVS